MGRQRGYSLLEALVALAVISVTLAIAGRLLIGANYLLMAAGREARDPVIELVVRQIRNDVQGSGFTGRTGIDGPRSTPMILLGHPLYDRIIYERTSDLRLVRRAEGASGSSSRVLLENVVSWRWDDAWSPLVSIQISYREEAWRGNILHPAGELLAGGGRVDLQWLNFTMRGGGGGSGW